jgi:hypothetical protein
MTANADIVGVGSAPSGIAPALQVRDTGWGFVVNELGKGRSYDLLTEAALKLAAVALVIAAGTQWLLPGSMFAGGVLVMKLALTAGMGGLALLLFRFANRGFVAELQVDAVLREVRVGSRNTQGILRVMNRVSMRDIEECFVRPGPEGTGTTELCFRVAGLSQPVQIAAGSIADLAPVLERLTRDLRTPRERVELRMAS